MGRDWSPESQADRSRLELRLQPGWPFLRKIALLYLRRSSSSRIRDELFGMTVLCTGLVSYSL